MAACANLAIVLGILSPFILTILFGPASIVLGVIGGTGGYARGWVGMIFGILSTAGMVLLMVHHLSMME